jgi:hypothetical protein
MHRHLKFLALTWAHKVVSSWRAKLEAQLKAETDPFTEQDMQDEVLNRYPA